MTQVFKGSYFFIFLFLELPCELCYQVRLFELSKVVNSSKQHESKFLVYLEDLQEMFFEVHHDQFCWALMVLNLFLLSLKKIWAQEQSFPFQAKLKGILKTETDAYLHSSKIFTVSALHLKIGLISWSNYLENIFLLNLKNNWKHF